MSWHRLRRGVFGKPKPQEYKRKKKQLEQLKQLDSLGVIELYYLDETGFCLTDCVPLRMAGYGRVSNNSQ